MPAASRITPGALRDRMLFGAGELALIDVSEEGQFGLGHALWAVNVPYSRLELLIGGFVPRRTCPVILMDQGDGVGLRAARRLRALGYGDVAVLEGGMPAWRNAGFGVFQGVFVPSKAFGEWVEAAHGTPTISAPALRSLIDAQSDVAILDPRTVKEHAVRHVPGAIACPSAELVYRIHDLVPSPDTLVVVACGGRTRGIIGAQTLIDAGLPHRVVALEDGNHGWQLAGYALESDLRRQFGDASEEGASKARVHAAALARRMDIPQTDDAQLAAWLSDDASHARTTFVLDVRSPEEFQAGHHPAARSAPGGQLIQAADRWLGTLGARVVLVDDDGVRAPQTAYWLAQMGWEVHTLRIRGTPASAAATAVPSDGERPSADAAARVEAVMGEGLVTAPEVSPEVAQAWIARGAVALCVDTSEAFLAAHPPDALWANRARLASGVPTIARAPAILLFSKDGRLAHLAAIDLSDALPGWLDDARILVVAGGQDAWTLAGMATVPAAPGQVPDADRIDFLFWAHERRQGNRDAMRTYLDWEKQLLAQARQDHPSFPAFRDRGGSRSHASFLTASPS